VAYHSQRSARGRGRTHRHSGSGNKHGNGTVTSNPPVNGNGNTINGTAINGAAKYSPQSSNSQEMRQQPPSSPISIRNPSVAYDKNRKHTSWKTQGFYGREELDALAIDPWDFGNDEDDVVAGDSATVSTTDKGSVDKASSTQPSSPRGTNHRKLRDEEAQFAMQEGKSLTYHDFTKMEDEEMALGGEKDIELLTGKAENTV
jgi:hypothetical protein